MDINLPSNQLLSILIRDRSGVLFEGKAEALSSYNERGLFDILPLHTNFISLIKQEVIIKSTDGEEKRIPLESGVLKVNKNIVEVYLGILHKR